MKIKQSIIGGVEMNKGEKERCQETKDELYNIMMDITLNERYGLVIEFLNSHKASDKVGNFLISLIF